MHIELKINSENIKQEITNMESKIIEIIGEQ